MLKFLTNLSLLFAVWTLGRTNLHADWQKFITSMSLVLNNFIKIIHTNNLWICRHIVLTLSVNRLSANRPVGTSSFGTSVCRHIVWQPFCLVITWSFRILFTSLRNLLAEHIPPLDVLTNFMSSVHHLSWSPSAHHAVYARIRKKLKLKDFVPSLCDRVVEATDTNSTACNKCVDSSALYFVIHVVIVSA